MMEDKPKLKNERERDLYEADIHNRASEVADKYIERLKRRIEELEKQLKEK